MPIKCSTTEAIPENVTIANTLQLEAARATPLEALRNALYKCSTYLLTYLLFRFNYDAMPSLKSLNRLPDISYLFVPRRFVLLTFTLTRNSNTNT